MTGAAPFSIVSLSRNVMDNLEELSSILARIDDPRLIRDFLICILTPHELEEIDGRWQLVKMLDRGVSQRKIAETLHMSLCKITRGSKELHKRNSAFRKIIDGYLSEIDPGSYSRRQGSA